MVSLANPPVTVTGALPPPAHPAGLKALSSTDTVNGVTCQPSCDSHGCLAASYLACITITYEGEITVMWLQLASFLDKNLSPLESIPATCLTHLTAIISAALVLCMAASTPASPECSYTDHTSWSLPAPQGRRDW
ncbi:uncharacterized protein LOC135108515 [Scylla paramamosain]|uniref:uncharacterized protein LOC135108515 n=1 Tax=Scylla paramamosain TaxID=85552 RepID=UPI003083E32E